MSDSQSPSSFIAPSPADLAPLFPGYEIGPLIATGGMGAVYQAVQKSLDRDVAIKILPYEFGTDEDFRERFESEAKAMARLNHPNLIGVYDFGEASGMFYIIMEYVPGGSLFQSSHGTAIDPMEAIRIVTGICSGLAHAHDNGIIHRDIKPANILLDPKANPKIGDFGLARPADHKIHDGEVIFGTPHYTAPEVVDSPQNADHRADIFSVGVILHELLTGRLPADDHRTASAIAHCDPRLDSIIRRATDPTPENRYFSAHEIERELHDIATTTGPRLLKTAAQAAPRRIRHVPVKQTSGHPGLVFLLIAVITAAAGYFIVAGKSHPPKETIPNASANVPPQTRKPEPSPAENTQEPPALGEVDPVPPEPRIDESSTTQKPAAPESRDHEAGPATPITRDAPVIPPEVESLNSKARELIITAALKRDEQLSGNARKMSWDLDLYLRTLPKSKQAYWLPHVNGIKKTIENNRVPDSISPSNDLELSPPMKEITNYAVGKQKQIDQGFLAEAGKIHSAYLRKIGEAAEQAQAAGNKPLADSLNSMIDNAPDPETWIRSFGDDEADQAVPPDAGSDR